METNIQHTKPLRSFFSQLSTLRLLSLSKHNFQLLLLTILSTFNFQLSTHAQETPFPTDHLQLWLRADSVELTDGKVSRWYDLSPNNYIIQQTDESARPTINGNALNGQPALQFNGTSTFLNGGNILNIGNKGWAYFIVARKYNEQYFFSKGDRNNGWVAAGYYNWFIGNSSMLIMNGTVINQGNGGPSNVFAIYGYELYDRTSLSNKTYLNGVLKQSININNNNANNSYNFNIGKSHASSNGYQWYSGEIAEIIAFNTVDDSLRYSVNEYLVNKYFPDQNTQVSLGLDLHVPYGFCDTAITTAYNPNFISYQWSTGETDSVIHVNRSGRYTVTVTNSFGVTSTDDINVYFPEVHQIQDTTICAGDTIYWDTGLDADNYTFQWFNGNTPITLRSLQALKALSSSTLLPISDSGSYTCLITDSLGCTFQTDALHITIDNYPISTSFRRDGISSVSNTPVSDTSICSGNTLGLATNIDETTSYIWNTGASSSRITIIESGDYSLTTTNSRGCRAVNSIHINILGEAPEINYAVDNLCFGDSTSFIGNAQSPQGINSYLWIVDGTDSISTPSFNYGFPSTGIHNIRNIVTSNNSCRSDSTFSITIKDIARPDFTYTPVCYGVPMDFIDNSSIPEGTTVESYTWMIGDSIVGTEENLTYTFNSSTLHHSLPEPPPERSRRVSRRDNVQSMCQRVEMSKNNQREISQFNLKHTLSLSNGCSSSTTIEVSAHSEYSEPRFVSPAYPTNGMFVSDDSILFTWNYDYDILYYNLITSSSEDFSNADTIPCTTNSITLQSENFADTTYWKVISYNHCLLSFESEPYSFRKTAGDIAVSNNSNLQLWLRADSVELTDGKVSRWYDLSPNNYIIQQTDESARPTINGNALNGQPALQFNGTSTFLNGGNILNIGNKGWAYFIVARKYNEQYFFSKGDRNNGWVAAGYYNWFIGNSSMLIMNGTVINQGNGGPSNVFAIYGYELYDRTSLSNKTYLNGVLKQSININNNNANNSYNFNIGKSHASSNGYQWYSGEIAEIIAFNTVDDSLRYSGNEYLVNKYFPEQNTQVSLGLDIHVPYGFCDTAITTAYNPDFISYLWSTGETDSVIHANRSGRYTVTVTNSFGVTSTDDINVYFPEHNQLQDTTICAGDTILWNIKMRQDEYAFQWYKDGEQYGEASNQIEISEAGAYSCIITDSLGCTFQTDTAHITIDNYPISAGFGASDTTLCYGNRLHIVSGYDETASAIWQDGNTDLEHYLTQPGTYTVTTTNTRGCTATNSINVTLRGQVPTPNFSIEGHCQNIPINIIDLSTSAVGDITARQWYANDSLIGSETEISHSFAEFGTQKVKLFLETSDNCVNDTTIFVYIDPQPQPDFSPKSFCQNAETEINTQHAIAEGEIVSTLWSIEGETLYGDNISKSFAGIDLVPVTITAESVVGCSGSRTYEVVVRQTEKPAMNISGLCLGSATEFTNTTPFSNTNPQIAWEWSFGDNTGISSRKNPVHIYDSIGNYTISMSVTFANHCTTSIDTTISIFLQPEASIITANGCVGGHTEMLANISSDDHIYNYRWSIGDIYESNEAQPIFIADSAGFFPVSLEITTDHLCKAVATGYLNIHGHLNVSFTQSRDWGGSPLYVEFENTSEDATSYHWNFGGAGESNQTNPYFIFTEPGTYEVSLTGTNEFGCTGRYTSPAITVVEPIVDIMLMDLKANEENGFAKISLIIVNLGTLPVEDLVLELKINNQIYRETIGHIAQGAVVPHTFGTMIPIPNSASIANTICVEALVPDSEGHSETNLANNTLCITDAENLSVGIPYPIPAYEQITCDIYTKIPTDLDISIFSIFGKLVKHETISQHKGYMKYVVNVTDLSGGMYFIRVNSKDESITHKFEIR